MPIPETTVGALYLLARIREALGDNGTRMQDELLEYCRELRDSAGALAALGEDYDALRSELKTWQDGCACTDKSRAEVLALRARVAELEAMPEGWRVHSLRLEAVERQRDQAIGLLETMLRYSDYGTTPTEEDNAVIDARAFFASLKR